MLAGANLPEATFQDVKAAAARCPHVIVERARPDFRALLSRAALSISQGGYNTLMDVLSARCPAVIVPFAGGAESEQSFRAAEFARRGLISVIAEADLSPRVLADTALAVLQRPHGAPPAINLDGASETARHVTIFAGSA